MPNRALSRKDHLERYKHVRRFSEEICAPLENEDYVVQTMPDVSPAKWHLAHTSWFFETFILQLALDGYFSPDPQYAYLYNSYYNALGDRHCRPRRGLLSRPTVSDTYAYRAYVDKHMETWICASEDDAFEPFASVLDLGIHHEQQHQELMVTDLKHVLGTNPLRPIYREITGKANTATLESQWISQSGGIYSVGHEGHEFSFDNEGPRHQVLLQPFSISDTLVTNGEFVNFMEASGYANAELWLSPGWSMVISEAWNAPLYWERIDGTWMNYTLGGWTPVDLNEPVCHVSYFEADAYARWAGMRLPTEFEWEVVAAQSPVRGRFADDMRFHPSSGADHPSLYGDVWQWTRSQYTGYPGYAPAPGALGEYNGKFMCNQFVLRGGSCASSASHIRPTYRNFFPPDARWQFTGIRLARDA